MPRPMPRLAPVTSISDMISVHFSAGRERQRGYNSDKSGNFVAVQSRLAEVENVLRGIAFSVRFADGAKHDFCFDDGAEYGIAAHACPRHFDVGVFGNDGFHLLGMNLIAADIDRSVLAPDKIESMIALFHGVSGVDKAVWTPDRAFAAENSRRGTIRANTQGPVFDPDVGFGVGISQELLGKALLAIGDFESNARFGRGKGVEEHGAGKNLFQLIKKALIDDFAGQPNVTRANEAFGFAHQSAPPMRRRAGDMSDSKRSRALKELSLGLVRTGKNERLACERTQQYLKSAIAANIVEGAPEALIRLVRIPPDGAA